MFPLLPLNPHPDMLHPYHSPSGSSDIPSDFRAFYPYTPNEVKHRKRTTSTQLRTLENVFKRETKPNATLRNQLAEELKMTPRGVQVWFQNRRAKEKTKTNKAKVATESGKQQDAPSPTNEHCSQTSPDPSCTESQTLVDQPQGEQPREITITVDPVTSRNAPPVITPPQLCVFTDPDSSTWNSQTNNDETLAVPNQRPGELTAAQIFALRRGSLPVHSPHQPTGHGFLYPPNMLIRRGSVDTSLRPAGLSPYGRTIARGPKMLSGRSPPLTRTPQCYPHGRSGLPPQYMDMRRGSMDSRIYRGTFIPSQPPPSIYHGPRASLPQFCAVPSRPISSPGPGPLPSPNFQFGAASSATAMASSSSGDSDRNSPDSPNSFTYKEGDCDDDNTSVGSYVPQSRFGSFQSIATSESGSVYTDYTNPTSALPSPAILNGRRHSCTPAFVRLMSDLSVNNASPNSMQEAAYPHDEARVADNEFLGNGASVNAMFEYAPSTGDAGCSQDPLPVSRDSELAFALENQSQQVEPFKLEAHMSTALQADSYYLLETSDTSVPEYEPEPAYSYSYLPNNHTNDDLQTPVDYTQCAQLYSNYGNFLPASAIQSNDNASQTAELPLTYA